ncbi:MAG: threonylcarbamoyl-AMP synthase [Deltaproteobacteria bacterium]|nr:threonylcarbamoyl-AMP synthase [Deltaproteobacteria bacterium]
MTTVLKIDPKHPQQELILQAAEVLRGGGLVAFPTETVYGLGAIATDAKATARIFEAKERPATSPLIVHVASIAQAARFAARWPDEARALADAFWPGPLSIVLGKSPIVPAAVSGGGETVAMRAPAHPVAVALIEALGEGIAAPSANRSSRLPPVRAEHVLKGLDGRIDLVLDAGACPGGLESTVLDLSGAKPRVLRRGAISLARIASLVEVEDASRPASEDSSGWIRMAPVGEFEFTEVRSGAILVRERALAEGVAVRVLGEDARAYASRMYDALHELEDAGCEVVWIEQLPAGSDWDAIRDRLRR